MTQLCTQTLTPMLSDAIASSIANAPPTSHKAGVSHTSEPGYSMHSRVSVRTVVAVVSLGALGSMVVPHHRGKDRLVLLPEVQELLLGRQPHINQAIRSDHESRTTAVCRYM